MKGYHTRFRNVHAWLRRKDEVTLMVSLQQVDQVTWLGPSLNINSDLFLQPQGRLAFFHDLSV